MDHNDTQPAHSSLQRRESVASQDSHTAADFISSQLQLEADAREALPYQFDTCTYSLGPLNQSVFSCLTCNPPPSDPSLPYIPAGVCYACSISCHGEHELVELFTRRHFVCDCGTTRLPATSKCTLRVHSETGVKGDVHSESPSASNTYNQNFRNRFCGCAEDYDAHSEKGTMFQCLGLATPEQGGCGEDWWHPECIMGLPRDWYKGQEGVEGADAEQIPASDDVEGKRAAALNSNGTAPALESIAEEGADQPIANGPMGEADEHPVPPGFPNEDDFDHFICYKCVEVYPWMKRYAKSPGFLPALTHGAVSNMADAETGTREAAASPSVPLDVSTSADAPSLKRKAGDLEDESTEPTFKKPKSEHVPPVEPMSACKRTALSLPTTDEISLFVTGDFREHFCRCPDCFPRLAEHPQLLEEETIYEPPRSEGSSDGGDGTGSVGSRSLFDRGEAALSNMDRVRAIEGVMAYNKLRDNLKSFLKPFAESGQAVGAEDIKKHFEKLRGDDQAIREAQGRAAGSREG